MVSEERKLDFPNGLELTVTLESDAPLSEARLYYRTTGSRVWAYSNAELLPETEATVLFQNLLRDSVYLPPGTVIEYYYTIKDTEGRSLETKQNTIEYADDRFQWEEITVGPLSLFYHDISPSRVEHLGSELEPQLRDVANLLELTSLQPIRGFVYNSYAEASPAFPKQSRTITDQQVFHGFAFQQPNVFVGIGMEPRLIVHESTHLMLAQALDSGGRAIPSWLDEGLAGYVEPGSRPYSGQSLSGQGLPLSSMSTLAGTPQEINYFYLKSESVVAYLIEEHGVDSFRSFLAGLREGNDVDAALTAAYGFDLVGLEAAWSTSDSGRTAFSPGRFDPTTTPFLFFNSWFLGLLVLIVMALVLIRYITRKIRSSSESDEFDWDD